MDLTKAEGINKKILRDGKNTQNYTKSNLMARKQWWCNHSLKAKYLGVWSQVGLRKHHYEQN